MTNPIRSVPLTVNFLILCRVGRRPTIVAMTLKVPVYLIFDAFLDWIFQRGILNAAAFRSFVGVVGEVVKRVPRSTAAARRHDFISHGDEYSSLN